MVKGVGAVAIFCAAAWLYREMRAAQRMRCDMVSDLRGALEDMAHLIRSVRLPLPDAVSRQSGRPLCGVYFRDVSAALGKGKTLQEAWQEGFSPLDGQEGRILRGLSLQGDETLLLGQLHYTAQQLNELETRLRSEDRSRKKIQLAATFSLACLLMIILL